MKTKLNLSILPEIRAAAGVMATRRRISLSQLFEDLIEAELDTTPPQALIDHPRHVGVNKAKTTRQDALIFGKEHGFHQLLGHMDPTTCPVSPMRPTPFTTALARWLSTCSWP